MKSINKLSFVVIVSLLMSVSFVFKLQAQSDGFYEMRCRGGEDHFRIDLLETDEKNDEAVLGLNFSPSSRGAGEDSSGLDLGTCSWVDRALRDGEPQQIQLRVKGAEIDQISDHLQKEGNFWSFWVSNTNRGYYETKNHKMWKPDAEK